VLEIPCRRLLGNTASIPDLKQLGSKVSYPDQLQANLDTEFRRSWETRMAYMADVPVRVAISLEQVHPLKRASTLSTIRQLMAAPASDRPLYRGVVHIPG